jgi:hypothetical protein
MHDVALAYFRFVAGAVYWLKMLVRCTLCVLVHAVQVVK